MSAAGDGRDAPAGSARRVVVKVGSSSVTTPAGDVDVETIGRLAADVAEVVAAGSVAVVVSSGAIAAGWSSLAPGAPRPGDPATLQAVAALGQHRLMTEWHGAFAATGLLAGQVLLAPLDFVHRSQYVHARRALAKLLDLGVVPVVNENDVVADEEIRFGDNDRLAALVAHLVDADLLVLLTDTAGLFTGDPRRTAGAALIEEVAEIDRDLERVAGGAGTDVGSGGMASKLAAAKMATWSGVETVIADASRPGVVGQAVAGQAGIGTRFRPRPRRMAARKLWIAFAVGSAGTIEVDEGARRALVERGTSLLAAGVVGVRGEFGPDDPVDVATPGGPAFARGLVRYGADRLAGGGWRSRGDGPGDGPSVVIHRDDLVILSGL